MSGPQFVHIQTWSLKANVAGQSIAQVIAEATRDPEYSTHVKAPVPPRVLLGDPGTFAALHAAHVAARSTRAKMSDGTERVRAIRSDRHTMASIVMSYPVPIAAIKTDEDRQKLARWEQRNLAWLRARYGDQLKVVLAHEDETHPHLHAWLLPDDPGADATTLHPGKVAKRIAEAEAKAGDLPAREAVKRGNRALKDAMTVWQDAYHEAVGSPEGLTRSGPKRRRLTREQWRAEKETARANAAALGRAEEAELRAVEVIDQAKAKAARINSKAQVVGLAVEALVEELKAGTLYKVDGRVVTAHPDKIRPGLPEIRPVLHAAADAGTAIRAERAALAQDRKEVAAEKTRLAGMIDQMKAGFASLLQFIRKPGTSAIEQIEAARLAKTLTPMVDQAKKLVEPSPPPEETGKEAGSGLDGPGL